MGTALDTLKKWSSLLDYNLPNLVLLDAKFPRQIFYFAKLMFPYPLVFYPRRAVDFSKACRFQKCSR